MREPRHGCRIGEGLGEIHTSILVAVVEYLHDSITPEAHSEEILQTKVQSKTFGTRERTEQDR